MDTKIRRPFHFFIGAFFIALSLLVAFHHQAKHFQAPHGFLVAEQPLAGLGKPLYQQGFVSGGITRLVHSATAIQRQDGVLQAFWFGGSREGHPDVAIFTATYDPAKQSWSDDAVVVTRQATQASEHRLIKKLGNPAAVKDQDGRLWLFFVSVSIGGWSGSSINLTISGDQGRNWSNPRQLITSPFLNISTLVKGSPFFFKDGTIGLPVYHEFLGKFSEVLRLDAEGRVIDKVRITSRRLAIQPVVYPLDATSAVALMRNTDSSSPKRAWISRTDDGGANWRTPKRTDIFNRDSAIGGCVIAQNAILSVVNFSEHDRDSLSLLLSQDQGQTWSFIHDVEARRNPLEPDQFFQNVAVNLHSARLSQDTIAEVASAIQCESGRPQCDFRFDYPYLIKDRQGVFHLFYTWNRAFIRHVAFNAAWLDQQPKQPLDVLIEREATR